MMNSPLVSVIIPTYNRWPVLKRAVESVLNQSFKDFELIVVDDGSTDETAGELKENSHLQYFFQENKGVSAARNLGVKKSQGKYISFLDSDDEWLSHKLEKQMAFLKTRPDFRWVHGEEIWIRNGVRVNPMKKHQKGGGDQFSRSLSLCLISPSTVLMEKSLFWENAGFDEAYPVCEDYDLWLKMLRKNPIGFVKTPLIYKYGGHEDQLSRKFFAMDFWRVKTLVQLLTKQDLKKEQQEELVQVALKKCSILIKGYKKHQNLTNLETVQKWSDSLSLKSFDRFLN